MIGGPLFISFINLEMQVGYILVPKITRGKENHLDTSAEESVRSLIVRIASAAAS